MIISTEAAAALKRILVNYCFQAGLGFRVLGLLDDSQALTVSIKVDKLHEGDLVLNTNGIRIFVDPDTSNLIADFKLDYNDELEQYFILSPLKEKAKTENRRYKEDVGSILN